MSRILIVGAGAVGSYYGALISKAHPERVTLLARGESFAAIKKNGVKTMCDGKEDATKVDVTDDVGEVGRPDYVMVTSKMYDFENTLRQLEPVLKGAKGVFGIENGIDKEEILLRYVSSPIYANTYVGVVRVAPGVVQVQGGHGRVFLGEANNSKSDRVNEVNSILNDAGIESHVPENIHLELWLKFVAICTTAGVCAAARCNMGQALSYEPTRQLMIGAATEAYAVAAAYNSDLDPKRKDQYIANLQPRANPFRPSMAVDFIRGNRTEVDYLNGALIRKAKAKNIAVPIHEVLHAVISSPKDLSP